MIIGIKQDLILSMRSILMSRSIAMQPNPYLDMNKDINLDVSI